MEQGIPDASVVVYRGRNVLAKLENAGLMIKSYKRPRLAKGLVYHWLRKPKCRRAFSNGMRLREMGIRTPEPFFAVEIYNRYGALANSFYACELLKGWKEMRGVQNNPDFDAIARAFAAFIFSMHIKGVFMSDLTPGNVLFRTGEDGYEFALVDINRMTFDCNSWKELSKNFRALLTPRTPQQLWPHTTQPFLKRTTSSSPPPISKATHAKSTAPTSTSS